MLDELELNTMAIGIASDSRLMLQVQSLSDTEISDICALFQVNFSTKKRRQRLYLHPECGDRGVGGTASNFA